MRDRYFFPLAAILAGAFVFMALNPYAKHDPSGPVSGGGRNAQDVTVKGEELHRFIAGYQKTTEIEVVPGDAGGKLLRITRQAGDTYDDPRRGPNLVLAEDLEQAFSMAPVEVVIEARAAGDFPASQFEANYFAQTEFESGWQTFNLTKDFQPYSLKFVPPKVKDLGNDFIGIRPVAPDKHRVMEVRSVRIHTTGPKGSAPQPAPASSGIPGPG